MSVEAAEEYINSLPYPPDVVGKWMGGAFEIGGGLSFVMQRDSRGNPNNVYIRLLMILTDTDRAWIEKLQKLFGGAIGRANENSFQWRLFGIRARALTELMEPYAPSRRDIIVAARLSDELDTEGRLELVEEMRGLDRISRVTEGDYKQLVQDNLFLTGIIETRRRLATRVDNVKGKDYTNRLLFIHSINRPLLDALKGEYGGAIKDGLQEGDLIKINGKEAKIKHSSFEWGTSGGTAIPLLKRVSPHSFGRSHEFSAYIPK